MFYRFKPVGVRSLLWKQVAACMLLLAGGVYGQADVKTPSTAAEGQNRWTTARVFDAMQWREGELRRGSFSYSEKLWCASPTKNDLVLSDITTCDVKAADGQLAFVASGRYPSSPTLDYDNLRNTWSGQTCTSLVTVKSGPTVRLEGRIEDKPPRFLEHSTFRWVADLFPTRALSTNLKKAMAQPDCDVSVVSGTWEGEAAVTLTVKRGHEEEGLFSDLTLVFLPEKDFILASGKSRFFDRKKDAQPDTIILQAASDLKKIDGLWFALRMSEELRSRDGKLVTRTLWDVSKVSRRPPEKSAMAIRMPTGSYVMDLLDNRYYRIRPDGSTEDLEFFNSETGKLVTPRQNTATKPNRSESP